MDADTRRNSFLVLGVAVIVALVSFLVLRDEDDDVNTSETTTTITVDDTTTTTTAETTTTGFPPSEITAEEAAAVVWPSPDGGVRYDDPETAVAGFAEDFAGFADPVYGEFQQGDARSGEVEVRAIEDGAVTTVFARQLSDGTWWILGAATEDIQLDDPIAGQAVDTPLLLAGQARAFEGNVQVAVYERGNPAPLGTGFVTGSGDGELGPFAGEVVWDNPGGGWGVVLLSTTSAEDGRVWQVAALPVGFIGGD